MRSPVEVLRGNILKSFEAVDPDKIRQSVSSQQVSPAIDYDNALDKVKMPHANKKTREIYLQETYLSYLWSLIYSIFVMYEEGVQKPIINGSFAGYVDESTVIVQRARKLYEWAISLIESYSPWDISLPNPERHNSKAERFYAEKVNNIFQTAVSYNLLHEFAHLTLGHDSYFDKRPISMLNESERADRIQIENEADDYAFALVISTNADDREKLLKGVSIIMANTASLLVAKSPKNVAQIAHPDLDDRLHRGLIKLNLEEEESQFYGWYLGVMAMRLFIIKNGLIEQLGEHETAQDAFSSYLAKLDKLKSS